MKEIQAERVRRAINTIGKVEPKSAQKRLSSAQALLYKVQDDWNEKDVLAAAKIVRSVGVTLMKEAAALEKLRN